MFDHVFFDNDGTLVDTEVIAQSIMLRMLAKEGLHIDPHVYASRYPGLRDEQIVELVEEDYNLRLPEDFIPKLYNEFRVVFDDAILPIPGIARVLENLNRPKSVVSNGSSKHVNRCINSVQFGHHFDGQIFGVEMVVNPKPAPDLYLLALETMGVPAHKAVIIEDSVTGVRAGKAAGVTTIGFLGAGHLPSQHRLHLEKAGADHIIENGNALYALFHEWGLMKT